jgi:hypothetical protein
MWYLIGGNLPTTGLLGTPLIADATGKDELQLSHYHVNKDLQS